MFGMGRGLLWIWCLIPQLGINAAQTYLSEKDDWNISYRVESLDADCHGQIGWFAATQVSEVDSAVRSVRNNKPKPDCEFFLHVKLNQEATYDGIVVADNGHDLKGFAVGEKTIAKIFMHSLLGPSVIGINTLTSGSGNGTDFFIKTLDETVASKAHPSLISKWTKVIPIEQNKTTFFFRLPDPIWKGGFQVGQQLDPSKIVVGGGGWNKTELLFQVPLPDFLRVKDQWRVSFRAFPYCVPVKSPTACQGEKLTILEARACVDEMNTRAKCSTKLEATLIDETEHEGMIYDSEGSTTPALAVGKELLANALWGDVHVSEPWTEKNWTVEQVQFFGKYDHPGKCDGTLVYKTRLDDKLPSRTSPANLSDWQVSHHGVNDFHFIEKAGFYRARSDVQIERDSDFQVAIKQYQECTWQQSKVVIRASVSVGPIYNYTNIDSTWDIKYSTSLLSSKECDGLALSACVYHGDMKPPSLSDCIDQVKKLRKECLVRLEVEAFQNKGHRGVAYADEEWRTFGLAMTYYLSDDTFDNPVRHTHLASDFFMSDIQFNGTDLNPDCLHDINSRLVYRFTDNHNEFRPSDFTQWKRLVKVLSGEKGKEVEVYRPQFERASFFLLAVDQGGLDCKVYHLSGSFKVTFLY